MHARLLLLSIVLYSRTMVRIFFVILSSNGGVKLEKVGVQNKKKLLQTRSAFRFDG